MAGIVSGLLIVASGAAIGGAVGYVSSRKSPDALERGIAPVAGAFIGVLAAGVAGAGVAIFSPAWREAGVTAAIVGVGGPTAVWGYRKLER